MTDRSPLTNAEHALISYLADLSEARWSAGWLLDWEYRAWLAYQGTPSCAHDAFSPEEVETIRRMLSVTGTWPVDDKIRSTGRWSAEYGLRMVPLKEWVDIHEVKHPRAIG